MKILRITKKLFGAVFLLGAILGASTYSKADVIFNYMQIGPTVQRYGSIDPGRHATFGGQIVVTEDAYANGFSFSLLNTPARFPFSSSLEGLVALELTLTRDGNPSLVLTLADLLVQRFPGMGFVSEMHLMAGPSEMPSGTIKFNNTETDFQIVSAADRFNGNLGSDGPQGCFFARCDFSGAVVVTVPAPASLALFAIGLMALAAVSGRSRSRHIRR